MKKTLLIFGFFAAIGCKCLPQPPPQYLEANASCEAYLPNYLEYASVINNCGDAALDQEPPPGTILNAATPAVEVTLTATNAFGNTDVSKFDVYLWASPKIIWDSIPGDSIPPVADYENDIDLLIKRREEQIAYLATKGIVPERDSITWRQMPIHYPPRNE